MINKVIIEIENITAAIKAKDNSHSFSEVGLIKFEFTFFLTMDIVRYELIKTNRISDLTGNAISQLFAFQCFEFYYRDYPDLFTKTADLFSLLCEYNTKLKNNDLEGKISAKPADWVFYFKETLSKLI